MTGFGASQVSREGVEVKVELRAVNHRFFDSSIRISHDYSGLEPRVRERLAERIGRGRVNVSLEVQVDGNAAILELDEKLGAEYGRILRAIGTKFGIEGQPDPVAFAQLPDLVTRAAPQISLETVGLVVDVAMEGALEQLSAMRQKEGELLERDLRTRIGKLESVLPKIEERAADSSQRARRRLEERVALLVPEGLSVDAERLATEVALLAEKSDVAEEIVRLRAHTEAFLGFLEQASPKGKRLDFLLQEMNREVNTIGSKTTSAEVAHLVVEMKEEIERLREQVQNVE
jgi:uncharacterized protein (TIGR00255 family)